MKISLYQVDSFTDRVFYGNPAAVCPLDAWLPDHLLLSIARENNLPETAYYVQENNCFQIRWFTPETEVGLCGHATLAAAYVIFNIYNYKLDSIRFQSEGGIFNVRRNGSLIVIDFPSIPVKSCTPPAKLTEGLSVEPAEVLESEDYIAVYKDEDDIIALSPNLGALKEVGLRGVVITAPGREVDFVSRFFAPKLGINEDPVTGSTHCELVPFWAGRLTKTMLSAKQLSRRGGTIFCELKKNRVLLSGYAVLYMEATIDIGA